ncbi:MAG TPA: hypothetical protein VJZ93_01760 [Candidatus Nanoarchaeia archaeon]|nr:hypothetical protein [Candidatus Nanoarchaeia archaeon]
MVKIVFTPDWFLNNDVLINLVSFFVLGLFFLFAIKSYTLNKKKSILYLGIGFLLVAIGELATVATKLVLYYDTEITKEIGRVIVTNSIVKSVDIFYYTGFFFNRLFSLIGFYIIYKIPSRKIFSGDFFLALVLIFIISTLANEWFYIYHITALALLILIINNYYQTYKNEKITNTKILISAFIILAISQILFLMSSINYMYVTAQSVQLVSYITLFFLVIKIIQNGKKKN